jgi:hypothetical protein
VKEVRVTMRSKENQCAVTTAVSDREKELLIETARGLDVPYYIVMRRLVRYFLDEKISWMDLFRQYRELPVEDEPENTDRKFIRTQLSPERYAEFALRAEEWGSTTGIVLRRLMLLYLAGKIGREAIWY